MTFQEFWPLYLRAHRLPGTRGLHYFATALGIMSAVEAIGSGRPLVFVLGIAISYAIAIGAHWFAERNQPLIAVNAFWGAVADLRMCWLAATGQMGRELARHGIVRPAPAGMNAAGAGQRRSRRASAPYARYALMGGSIAGVAAGIADLSDLVEPLEPLALPLIQLGTPILAFTAALVAASGAILAARQPHPTTHNGARLDAGVAFQEVAAGPFCVDERSLRRACLVLLEFGLTAFVLAELVEEGLPRPIHLVGGLGVLAVLTLSGALLARLRRAGRDLAALPSGPQTRGLRVDGRAHLVDMMEDLLSAGRRQAILAATLDAADLRPGERLIDIGCGTGELAIMAARILAVGPGKVTGQAIGIDATPGMIEMARQRARLAGSAARFEIGVGEALPLADETAQAVTSTFFFHHLPTHVKREAMREMWRVLAPGGRLVIADYGRARGLLGLIASFPMRFNFHEHVRGQLNGELERIILQERLGTPQVMWTFIGYIKILRVSKPYEDPIPLPARPH